MGSSESAAAKKTEILPSTKSSSRVWKALDLAVLSSWLVVTWVAVIHHEKWADEAQAWLLARNLDLGSLWFKELRYEGSPGLWHSILWVAQRLLHVPYSGLGTIGLLFAFAGVVLLVRRAPFPKPLSYLLVFSYFFIYQYGVIARPYVLLPLLAFASAVLFKDIEHPERITIALIFLANVSAHGILMAGCIGGAYVIRGALAWKDLGQPTRRRYMLSGAVMAGVLVFLFFVLKPPPDVEAMQLVQQRTLATIASRALEGINGAFFDFAPLTVVWLGALCIWCWSRTGPAKWLPLVMVFVSAAFYGYYGWVHHQGTILVATIAALWIAWPPSEELGRLNVRDAQIHRGLVAILVCLSGYQVWNAGVALRNDYRYPYSGAKQTAEYLKSVGGDQRRILGVGYGFVAVQAYFDHNLLVNRPTEYFHHGVPSLGITLNDDVMDQYHPDYVVINSWYTPENDIRDFRAFMAHRGYMLVHASNGYAFFKRSFETRQVYFTFRRNDLP